MRRTKARDGFALPIALMLVVVVGLLTGLALDRFAAQTLTVDRQVRGYQAHHLGRGLQEATWAWLEGARSGGRGIEDALAENGHAFDLQLPDGATFRVYLQDGQGTVLTDVLGLTSQDALNAATVLNALIDRQPAVIVEANTRRVGPAAVSVTSASGAVLDAVAFALLPTQEAEKLLRELERVRADEDVTRQDLSSAIAAAEIGSDLRPTVTAMLTAEPTLWMAVIELVDRRGSLLRRFEGYLSLEEEQASLEQGGTFLTFEESSIQ